MVSGHWPVLVAERLLTGVLPPDTERMPTVGIGRAAELDPRAGFKVDRPPGMPMPTGSSQSLAAVGFDGRYVR